MLSVLRVISPVRRTVGICVAGVMIALIESQEQGNHGQGDSDETPVFGNTSNDKKKIGKFP